jgi:hypothetical protein
MVDRDQRQPERPGQRLRRGEAHEQRADQPRALGDCDPLDVLELRARLVERLPDDRGHELQVPARCDLGHDAAVLRVEVSLRGDDVREDRTVPADERGRGLVAGGLEAEDQALAGSRTGSRHMISASSRLSV